MIRELRDPAEFPISGGTAVAVGAFDGLHRGHRALLGRMTEDAARNGLIPVVVSFDPLPGVFFGRIPPDQLLLTAAEKQAMLEDLGIAALVGIPFNESFAASSPEDFTSRLKKDLHVERLYMGEDFCLGKDRRGNTACLRELGKSRGFTTEVIPEMLRDGEIISATGIRSLLREGKVRKANDLLGYSYSISGEIVHGDGRGHAMGFPTANQLYPEEKLHLPNGVYCTRMTVKGQILPAVTNVGVRPTFPEFGRGLVVETYLLEGGDNFFGENAELAFEAFLRPEKRFENQDALLAQIAADIRAARELLSCPEIS